MTLASPIRQRPSRSSATIAALFVAIGALAPSCGESSSGSGAPTASAVAPKPPPPEATLFAPVKSVLLDLPVTKLLPRTVTAVLAVRDPQTALARLSALNGFADVKDPLAKEIDAAAKDLTKDLPEIAALAQHGVDLGKPVGVLWTDHDFDTMAIFAAVSDEAAMKRWLDERAKQAKGKREVLADGDAVVLRAKRDVTRAVVLRKGHVFWVRTRDTSYLPEDRVIDAAAALAKTAEADSLGADPAFTRALASLSFGEQATFYVNAPAFADGLLAARKKDVAAAEEALAEEQLQLTRAEAKKRKTAAEEAKTAVEAATRKKAEAERRAKDAEVFALVKDAAPGVAVGADLGDRELKLKAFIPLANAAAVKLLAPLRQPIALFDPALGPETAAHFTLDPHLLDFALDRLGHRSSSGHLPSRARSDLRALGVALDKLDPLLDGEVSFATMRETKDFAVVWGLSDPARAKVVLDEGWKTIEASERVAKGAMKRLAEGSFEIAPAYAGDLGRRVRVAGTALVVTTQPALADALDDGKPRATWMAASNHPALQQLARIEGASALLTFDGSAVRARSLWDSGVLGSLASFGALGLFGSDTAKAKKLRDQRDKVQSQLREIEKALDRHKDETWKAFAPRIGQVVLLAKPAEGGVAIHGGLFTPEPSITALAEAALAAWMSVGPRWERWGEMADLRKKLRDIDDLLDAERQKAMDELVGDVLRGLGASERPATGTFGGTGVPRSWDDPPKRP